MNKFATKSCKRFPPHLNNIPTTHWSVHRARAIELLELETPQFIPCQLWPPNSPDLNPVDYVVWEYCERMCPKHTSLIWTK